MKIRKDFVTNSSSTSYCVVGVCRDALTLPNGVDDTYEYCQENKLQFSSVNEEEFGVAGLDIGNMKDDETLREFKQRILDLLVKAFPGDNLTLKDIEVHVDGGYNG